MLKCYIREANLYIKLWVTSSHLNSESDVEYLWTYFVSLQTYLIDEEKQKQTQKKKAKKKKKKKKEHNLFTSLTDPDFALERFFFQKSC